MSYPVELFPPANHQDFERLCCDLFKQIWKDDYAVRYGLPGQQQHGVDLYGQKNGKWVAVQCKKRQQYPAVNITKHEIDKEVEQAKEFHKKTGLSELIIATTAQNGDSVDIQNHCRAITNKHQKEGLFRVTPMGWGALSGELQRFPDLSRELEVLSFFESETEVLETQANESLLERLNKIWKSRFFSEEKKDNPEILAKDVLNGNLISASPKNKIIALSWCSRLLSVSDIKLAERLAGIAAKSCSGAPPEELQIANKIILFAKNPSDSVLKNLLDIQTPSAISAAFIQKRNTTSPEKMVDWLAGNSLDFGHLDADGKFFYLRHLQETKRWDEALEEIKTLNEVDYEATPILYLMQADIHLAQAMPPLYRQAFSFVGLPFDLKEFPVYETDGGMRALSEAYKGFQKAIRVTRDLDCKDAALFIEDLMLWIELRNPDTRDGGLQKLRESLDDPLYQLRRLNFAVDFNIEFNIEEVNKAIETAEKKITNWGEISLDVKEVSNARFVLLKKENNPKKKISYINTHYETLTSCYLPIFIDSLRIEALAHDGQISEANRLFDKLSEQGLESNDKLRLTTIIADVEAGDGAGIEGLRQLYKQTENLQDLHTFVTALSRKEQWDDCVKYGEILFQSIPNIESAELYVIALNNTKQWTKIVGLLDVHPKFIDKSSSLFEGYVFALFALGRFPECGKKLARLGQQYDSKNIRHLFVQLHLASGEWGKLTEFVDSELQSAADRTGEELLTAARVAQECNLIDKSKQLAANARKKESNNPNILMGIYILASESGWENEDLARECFQQAQSLPRDPDGILQEISIDNSFIEGMRRDSDFYSDKFEQYKNAELPFFILSTGFNQSYTRHYLVQALANKKTQQMSLNQIYTYSDTIQDKNQIAVIPKKAKIILDASALMTFSLLKMLDELIENFKVTIPHATLFWLFMERTKLRFHQPSEIKKAKKLLHFVAEGGCKVLPSNEMNEDLASQVGASLSDLLSEADRLSQEAGQHIVVRSAPVYKANSFRDEKVDLNRFRQNLVNCQAVVNFLNNGGHLNQDAYTHAINYLNSQHEERWESEPRIEAGATLYLDGLSVTYFQYLNLLPCLRGADLNIFISEETHNEATSFTRYEYLGDESLECIARLESVLSTAIQQNKITVAPMPPQEVADLGEKYRSHPSVDIFQYEGDADYVVFDDHYLNKNLTINEGEKAIPIISSHQILNTLAGTLPTYSKWMTELRQMGYAIVPLFDVELEYQLRLTHKANTPRWVETAELKAIKDSLPSGETITSSLKIEEFPSWFRSNWSTFYSTLQKQWGNGIDIAISRDCSNFILSLAERNLGALKENFFLEICFINFAAFDSNTKIQYATWCQDKVIPLIIGRSPEEMEKIILRAMRVITERLQNAQANNQKINANNLNQFVGEVLFNFSDEIKGKILSNLDLQEMLKNRANPR